MATRMLSVRIDSELLASVKQRATALEMTVQEYVITALLREAESEERYRRTVLRSIEELADGFGGFETEAGTAAGAASRVAVR